MENIISSLAEGYISTNNKSDDKSRYGKLKYICIHHMAGIMSGKECASFFHSANRQASANYCIGYNGDIWCSVPENYRSWATSDRYTDGVGVSIELSNSHCGGNWPVNDVTINSLVNLIVDICKRYNKKGVVFLGTKDKTRSYNNDKYLCLYLHKWNSATACPGPYLESKMYYIASKVNESLCEMKGEDIVKCPYCGKEIEVVAKTTSQTEPKPQPKPQPNRKSNEEIAREVIRGVWGNGSERMNRLTAAGYDAGVIQDLVNKML